MRSFDYLPLFILSLMFCTSTDAEMYKHTDPEGITTYTDIEIEGSTQIKPPEGNTIRLPKYRPSAKTEEKTPAFYTAFSIVSPAQDATIRDNSGSVTVTFSLTPALNTEQGHSITVLVDNQPVVSQQTSLSINLTNLDRGSHSIAATVNDSSHQTLIGSNSINIHLKRFSIKH